ATALTDYSSAIATIKKAVEDYEKATKDFSELSKALPADFDKKLKQEIKNYEAKTETYRTDSAKAQTDITQLTDEKAKIQRERDRLKGDLDDARQQVKINQDKAAAQKDVFIFDEPQGKILRRLPEGIVEINLGSNALVRQGLTFTVLPHDFPEKGRQSRMFRLRQPNERGEYKWVERFIPKATIEVIEVLGPNLSRARITEEDQPIRDAAGAGDLLYNSVWR